MPTTENNYGKRSHWIKAERKHVFIEGLSPRRVANGDFICAVQMHTVSPHPPITPASSLQCEEFLHRKLKHSSTNMVLAFVAYTN